MLMLSLVNELCSLIIINDHELFFSRTIGDVKKGSATILVVRNIAHEPVHDPNPTKLGLTRPI